MKIEKLTRMCPTCKNQEMWITCREKTWIVSDEVTVTWKLTCPMCGHMSLVKAIYNLTEMKVEKE